MEAATFCSEGVCVGWVGRITVAMSSILSSGLSFLFPSFLHSFISSARLLWLLPFTSLPLQWQGHAVRRARRVGAVLSSHLNSYWVGYQVCILTWEQPSLPNGYISEPWCDTLGSTNTDGEAYTHLHTHTHTHSNFTSYSFIWTTFWQFIFGAIVAKVWRKQWFSDT